jgi:hypothetical protein
MRGRDLSRTAKIWTLSLALFLVVASIAVAAVIQQGTLRITVLSQVQPYKLPRKGTAPIAVFVSGHVGTANKTIPPQLEKLTVKVNRAGLLQSRGLPVCDIPQIQPASTERALSNCGEALIGSGRFWANIVLPDQGAYPTRGRLLIFNGRKDGRPAILAHIYTSNPFASSFVIVFAIRHIAKGIYGTQLSASLPQALGDWGYVDRIKLTLKRKYRHHGKPRSYFNAGCPAPKGFRATSYPLARVGFSFAAGKELSITMTKTCGVKE